MAEQRTFSSRELALLWRIAFPRDTDPARVESALRERIKELNCLYGISQLAERHLHSLDGFLRDLVRYLPTVFRWIPSARAMARTLIFST